MTPAKLAIDPLWRCLCPSWTSIPLHPPTRLLAPTRRAAVRCLQSPRLARFKSNEAARYYAARARDDGKVDAVMNPLYDPPRRDVRPSKKRERAPPTLAPVDYGRESTEVLYGRLQSFAVEGKAIECQKVAEILVKERREKPSLQIYNALILSNTGNEEGAAWRVSELLNDIKEDGLQPDVQTCHAALKVLSVHVDHLLRTDVLEYMNKRWIPLSDHGGHDVIAGLLREGLFEQALERLGTMSKEGAQTPSWLLDMTVYVLCEAGEISEAYRIMRQRVDSEEINLSRTMWLFFLDKASEARHHAGTSLAWSTQVNQAYINPSSGICLNVLSTAAQAADAVLATEVFTHLSKRGTAFKPIHYELLMSTYLATDPPDVKRAITILTIMALEKLEPSALETRPLYLHLRHQPDLLPVALDTLRELHDHDRKIPIAALNLLIECYVEQGNLASALKVYKQIHTFVPIFEGVKKSFANSETFNLLLKGCRVADPPDAELASFLVSELLALRIKPTPLTYDRLILVFIQAGQNAIQDSAKSDTTESRAAAKERGVQLLDWAFRHFSDMKDLGWMPRFGTVEKLSLELARLGDARCWDVLQAGEDGGADVDSWEKKGHWIRRSLEEVWEMGGKDADDAVVNEAAGPSSGRGASISA